MKIGLQPHFKGVYALSERQRNTGSKFDPAQYEDRFDPVTSEEPIITDEHNKRFGIDGLDAVLINAVRKEVQDEKPGAVENLHHLVDTLILQAEGPQLTEISGFKMNSLQNR